MTAPYTRINVLHAEDSAPKLGLAEWQESRFVTSDLDAAETGVTHHRFKAGKRQGFAHRHERAEELYVVLSGSGRIKLDDDVLELRPLVRCGSPPACCAAGRPAPTAWKCSLSDRWRRTTPSSCRTGGRISPPAAHSDNP